MRLIMLYHRGDAEKNTAFIELFRKECDKRGVTFSMFTLEDVTPEFLQYDLACIFECGSIEIIELYPRQ